MTPCHQSLQDRLFLHQTRLNYSSHHQQHNPPPWRPPASLYLLQDALHFQAQLCAPLRALLQLPAAALSDLLHHFLQMKSSKTRTSYEGHVKQSINEESQTTPCLWPLGSGRGDRSVLCAFLRRILLARRCALLHGAAVVLLSVLRSHVRLDGDGDGVLRLWECVCCCCCFLQSWMETGSQSRPTDRSRQRIRERVVSLHRCVCAEVCGWGPSHRQLLPRSTYMTQPHQETMIESLNLDPQAADVGYWFVCFFCTRTQ